MIRRELRFHGHGSLKYVYAKGSVVRGKYVSLKYSPNNRRRTDRLAVVVSRKVHKSAVVRNRIRRRIYESARQYQQTNQAYDMAFLVYDDSLATVDAQEIYRVVGSLRQKAGLLVTEKHDHAIVNTKE